MLKRAIYILLFILLLSLSNNVFSKEYYLRDYHNNKLLVMNEGEAFFKEQIDFDKFSKLYLCVGLGESGKFLILTDTIERYRRELKIVDANTGKIEKVLQLGYEPFKWSLSEDRNHFFISYQTSLGSSSFELLHFDVLKLKEEIMTDFSGKAITDLQASLDGKKLMVLTEINKEPQMIILGVSPLKVEGYIPVGKHTIDIYNLSENRVAILDVDRSREIDRDNASVKVIDLESNKVIDQCQCREDYYTYWKWHEKEHSLILATKSEMRYIGEGVGEFVRVNKNGIKKIDRSVGWFNVSYEPDSDCLYVLTEESLLQLDFTKDSIKKFKTGSNTYKLGNTYYFYFLKPIPNSELLMVFGPVNSRLKFVNTVSEKVVGKTSCGRKDARKLDYNNINGISISVNFNGTKYYVLNMATADITVLNNEFKAINYLVPEEPILGMFQITQPQNKTIVITEKKVYKIDEENDALVPIFEFKPSARKVQFVEEHNRVLVFHSYGILVVNPATLETNNFNYNQYHYINSL